jgi:hypothetical protein
MERPKREQVKQACQSCRKRKSKVCLHLCHLQSRSSDMKMQCDEVRPMCRSCMKNQLVCEYEFPQGRTRTQALSESHKRVQRQLHTCTSLIQSLQCSNSRTSLRILENLRRGDYSEALSLGDIAFRTIAPTTEMYPWEHASARTEPNETHNTEALPAISTLLPLQHDATVFPHPLNTRYSSTPHSGELWQRQPSVQATPESRYRIGSGLPESPTDQRAPHVC